MFNVALKTQRFLGKDKVHSDYIKSRDEVVRILTKEIQISKELMSMFTISTGEMRLLTHLLDDSIITDMIKSGQYRNDLELMSEVLVLLFAGFFQLDLSPT